MLQDLSFCYETGPRVGEQLTFITNLQATQRRYIKFTFPMHFSVYTILNLVSIKIFQNYWKG